MLLSVCVFGALDAMIKGRHGGLRDAVGKEQQRLIDAIDAAESDER